MKEFGEKENKENKEIDEEDLDSFEEEDAVCPNCGQSTDGDTTCPYCGAILSNDDDLQNLEDEEF